MVQSESKRKKLLRQFKVTTRDVGRVITAVKAHGANGVWTSTGNDLPGVPWAQAQKFKIVHSDKLRLFAEESGTFKRVVPESEKLEYMRQAILNPASKIPMARDSGYNAISKEVIGISRRAWAEFLGKQKVVQVSRAIVPARRRGGKKILGKGYLETDLIEAKRKDLHATFKTDDFYFMSLCDRLTGYSLFRKMNNKEAKTSADTIEPMLAEMARVLGTTVVQIDMDRGKEFHGDFKRLLARKNIKQKFVTRANRVETQNRIFQRNFYRLYNLRRGGIQSLTKQAQDITNNTWSKHVGMTPEEAAKADVAVLVPKFNAAREQSDTSYRKKPIKTDSTVRYLVKPRKLVRTLAYKSYRGKHWSAKVHKVADVKQVGPIKRYRVHGRWFDVDQLLVCGTDDPVVEREISKRKSDQDKKKYIYLD